MSTPSSPSDSAASGSEPPVVQTHPDELSAAVDRYHRVERVVSWALALLVASAFLVGVTVGLVASQPVAEPAVAGLLVDHDDLVTVELDALDRAQRDRRVSTPDDRRGVGPGDGERRERRQPDGPLPPWRERSRGSAPRTVNAAPIPDQPTASTTGATRPCEGDRPARTTAARSRPRVRISSGATATGPVAVANDHAPGRLIRSDGRARNGRGTGSRAGTVAGRGAGRGRLNRGAGERAATRRERAH